MKTIELAMTITRNVHRGVGLAAKRIDIFEVDCIAIIDYSFDGSKLDWNVMAFRFDELRSNAFAAHVTLDRDDCFFAALEDALDWEFIEDRIYEEDNEYAAACHAEDEAERADYRRTAL